MKVESGDYILCDASIMQEGYILAKVVKVAELGRQWTIIPIKVVLGKLIEDEEEVCRRKLNKVIKIGNELTEKDDIVEIHTQKNQMFNDLHKEINRLKKNYHNNIIFRFS